jgi:hypothetical protein
MSEQVSTFLPVDIGKKRYLFFIVTWNDYATVIGEELDKQFAAFGEDLGPAGKVIKSYKSASRTSFYEVIEKTWPVEIRKRFDSEQDPFMLVVDKGFEEFNPESDKWGIVWFSNFHEKPGMVYRLFGALARKVRREDDVFNYLNAVARKDKFRKFGKYFELKKPKVFGVSIDVQAIIEDMVGV